MSTDAPQTWLPPLAYFGLMLIALPAGVYAPTHFTLRRLFGNSDDESSNLHRLGNPRRLDFVHFMFLSQIFLSASFLARQNRKGTDRKMWDRKICRHRLCARHIRIGTALVIGNGRTNQRPATSRSTTSFGSNSSSPFLARYGGTVISVLSPAH